MEKSITFIQTLIEKYSQRIDQLCELEKEILEVINSDEGINIMK